MLQRIVPATLAVLSLWGAAAHAAEKVGFALDWKFEGPSAAYFAAADNGHFEKAGLEVDIVAGEGSLDAIPKVATGAYPFGFADLNSLIKFLDQNPGAPVIAAMMIYDKPAFAIVGRKSLGIETPKDLEGKILGAPPPDGAWAQFKPFAIANDLDMDKIKIEPVGFPTREPMLAEGKVDAVTGFSFTSFLSVARLGVPEDDITTLLMADYGLDLYGNVVIVNTDYAKANPELVSGFLAAVAEGWKDVIADPAAGAAMVIKRNPAGDAALEQRRLELSLRDNVVTEWVKEHGMGGIDPARFDRGLEQLSTTYEFKNEPDASLYFTSEYLPEGNFPLN
jgi:NitT/TauT family transport system substrate-binding protein